MLCSWCGHNADDHNFFNTLVEYWKEEWPRPCNVDKCACPGYRPPASSVPSPTEPHDIPPTQEMCYVGSLGTEEQ